MSPANRPPIPAELERAVKVEAGHRCAIPTCRGTSVLEMAHIVPWAKVQEHTFDNLILLCAVCHGRYDRGDMDRKAMLQYKANLSVLSHRYGDLERRLLEEAATVPPDQLQHRAFPIPGSMYMLLSYLLRDGLIEEVSAAELGQSQGWIMGQAVQCYFRFTETGQQFVENWVDARGLN